jgi:hypothetical protein
MTATCKISISLYSEVALKVSSFSATMWQRVFSAFTRSQSCIDTRVQKGLPCVPLGAQLLKPLTKIEIHERDGGTTVDLRSVFFLTIAVVVLSVGLVAALIAIYRIRKNNRDYRTQYECFDVPVEHVYDEAPQEEGNVDAGSVAENLQAPLLETLEAKNDKAKEPRQIFV